MAIIEAENGNLIQAIELYTLASTYDFVKNSQWFADLFGEPIAELANSLPAERVNAAKENGRSLDL